MFLNFCFPSGCPKLFSIRPHNYYIPPIYIPLFGPSNKDWFNVQIMKLLIMYAVFNIFLWLLLSDKTLCSGLWSQHSPCALHLEWKVQFTTIRSVATRGAIKPLETERFRAPETWSGRSPLVGETRTPTHLLLHHLIGLENLPTQSRGRTA
jgi:hypothetical protein